MNDFVPNYLAIAASDLGKGATVKVRVLGDKRSIGEDMAHQIKTEIVEANRDRRAATLIIPVGPVEQYPTLARRLNADGISCRDVMFIGMDDYLTDGNEWIPKEHPLSFRGYLDRMFYDLIDPALAPPAANRIFPDPRDLSAIPRLIERRGGVDACFGGIGITGHIAFNEPPDAANTMSVARFSVLPSRIVALTPETRTINSVTVGGEISIVPRRAVTVGMKEILRARRVRLYCNRPWQSAVVRRVLHGPITPACPASLVRTHPDAWLTMTDYVAAPPTIQLR